MEVLKVVLTVWIWGQTPLCAEALNRADTDEARLFNHLFAAQNISKYVRPVVNPNDAVQVQISLALVGLEDLDERRQVMTSHIFLRQKWQDPFLTWNPEDFGNLKLLMVSGDHIWTPDIVPQNSLSDSYSLHHETLARVSDSGEVSWTSQSRLETFCLLDLSEFPYDSHNCSVTFGSAVYDAQKVNISHMGEQPDFDLEYGSSTQHQIWEMVGSDVTLRSHTYRGYPESYQDVTGHVKLKRRTTYVTHVYVAPAVMFVLLVPAVFMLPADSSNKFILGTGILICLMLLLLMLEDFLQSSYSTVPRLALYYLAILVLISFSLGVSAFVANLWNRSRRRSVAVPGLLRVVVLKGLGRLLCVHYDDFLSSEPLPDADTDTISTHMDSISNNSMNPLDGAKMIREYNSHVVNRAEWRQLAAILDRIFCFVFLVVSVLIATAILIKF